MIADSYRTLRVYVYLKHCVLIVAMTTNELLRKSLLHITPRISLVLHVY